MFRARFRRTVGILIGTGMLVVGSTTMAMAALPTPSEGPTSGGTRVTIDAPDGVEFTQMRASATHSLALGSDGAAYAWGYNYYGQLGDGTVVNRSVPVQVSAPEGVTFTEVSVGDDHSLAIGSDGYTYAWGGNGRGQLGDGTKTSRSTPVRVASPEGVTFTQISAGNAYTLALGSDGNTYSWGQNDHGQLGSGDLVDRSVPGLVSLPKNVTFTQISAGGRHALASGSDGKTYAWGYNYYGQLGDGTYMRRSLPVLVQVPAGAQLTQISAGQSHSLALDADNNVYAWGRNDSGQLGDTTTEEQRKPVRVASPNGVTFTQVIAGGDESYALGADSNAYSWGQNSNGQLGDGTTVNRRTPGLVITPTGVTLSQIHAGYGFSLGVSSRGSVYSWGSNLYGQLGDGSTVARTTPGRGPSSLVVTEISFDGTPGTALEDNRDGTWSVDAPAHAGGSVDITVSWTLHGNTQPAATHTNGYTYIDAPVIVTEALPEGTVGVVYRQQLTASGFPLPTFTVTEGSLPQGVTLSAEGVLAGTPTVAEDTEFTVTATNAAGTATREYSVTIANAPVIPDPDPDPDPEPKPGPGAKPDPTPAPENTGTTLANTGSRLPNVMLGGAAVLLLGAGLTAFTVRRTRRAE